MGQLSYPSLQSHSFEAKMQLTDEQRTIVSHVKANEGLTKISAVAGSGIFNIYYSILNKKETFYAKTRIY